MNKHIFINHGTSCDHIPIATNKQSPNGGVLHLMMCITQGQHQCRPATSLVCLGCVVWKHAIGVIGTGSGLWMMNGLWDVVINCRELYSGYMTLTPCMSNVYFLKFVIGDVRQPAHPLHAALWWESVSCDWDRKTPFVQSMCVFECPDMPHVLSTTMTCHKHRNHRLFNFTDVALLMVLWPCGWWTGKSI
jgi:hypothetical protein